MFIKDVRELECVVGRICDRCGLRADDDEATRWEFHEFFSHSRTGGPGSVFGDGDEFDVDLCQHCFKELVGPHGRLSSSNYAFDGDDPETLELLDRLRAPNSLLSPGVIQLVWDAVVHAFQDEPAARNWLFTFYPPIDSIPVTLLGTQAGVNRIFETLTNILGARDIQPVWDAAIDTFHDESAAHNWLFTFSPLLDSIPMTLLGTQHGLTRILEALKNIKE